MKSLRAQQIIDFVNQRNVCSLAELMERFGVSIATVHRDIGELVRGGRLRKVHGGVASLGSSSGTAAGENDSAAVATGDGQGARDHYRERLGVERAAKEAIAEQALAEVADGDILFLDSSTTVHYLLRALQRAAFSRLTLVSNSVLAIQEFGRFAPGCCRIGLGGNYDPQLHAFLGRSTVRELEGLSFDKAFVSAMGLDGDGFYSRHESHALFLGQVLARSRKKYLLADHTKFGKTGIFTIAPLSAVDRVLSDEPWPGDR